MVGYQLWVQNQQNMQLKLENVTRLALMFQMMSVIMSNHVAAVRLARYIQPSAEYPWFARIRAWQELLGRRLLQLTNFARFAKLVVECN
jgi:hypothetical protein